MSNEASLSDATVKESQERQSATLKNIQQLQEMEKHLYQKLQTASANNASTESQQQIIAKINELSQMRMTMFAELDAMYKGVQGRVAQSRIDLVDQIVVTGVVENELNNSKQKLNAIQADKNNKMRMVEINTYYSQQYRAQSQLMKLVIVIALILFVLIVISKQGWLPDNVMKILIGIVAVVGAYMIIKNLINISSRSNMNFDEFDWAWDEDANNPTVYDYDNDQLTDTTDTLQDDASNFAASLGLGCVGSNCCSTGTVYDSDSNTCVEAFSNQQKSAVAYVEDPTVTCPWKAKPSVVKPFSEKDDSYVRI
jgi:hypothetical protein